MSRRTKKAIEAKDQNICYVCHAVLIKDCYCSECMGYWGVNPPVHACPECADDLDGINGFCSHCKEQKGPIYEPVYFIDKQGTKRPKFYAEKIYSPAWKGEITKCMHFFWRRKEYQPYGSKAEREEVSKVMFIVLYDLLEKKITTEEAISRLRVFQGKYPMTTYLRDWTPF